MTAAGSGTRLGHTLPKALVPLAGRPILAHALEAVAQSGVADIVVVTVPPPLLSDARHLSPHATFVAGGATRQESVANALSVLPPETEIVLVHDAARPLTPPEVFQRVVEAVRGGAGAVVPALPVTDTIKQGEPAGQRVTGTVDRTNLFAVATPQGFRYSLLVAAHAAGAERAAGGVGATDDAGLVEALGEQVWLVPGSPLGLKITTPWDLEIAEYLATRR